MAENAQRTMEHVIKDQDRPAATACDDQDQGAQARRTRQMALIDGLIRDHDTALRELSQP